ncbi:MAG: ABC transporter permease [Acidimicrobiales bacterium]
MSASLILAYAIIGIGSGALIAGVGTGVVLSYRGSGVVNLSAGAIAMLGGYCYWVLATGKFGVTFPMGAAIVLTLLFSAVIGVLFEFGVVRPLRRQAPLAKLVATLGILLALQAAMVLAFGPTAQAQPSILPANSLPLFGVTLPVYELWIAGVVLLVVVLLGAAYRWTRFGIGTRAAAESEAFASLLGLSPSRYSMGNTVLMAVAMGLVGMLSASISEVNPTGLVLLIVPGLAAAMFGRLTSFSSTFIAGILIGAAESVLLYFSTQSWFPTVQNSPLPGVDALLVLIVLVIATFFRAGKIPSRGAIAERRLPRAPTPIYPLRTAAFWLPIAAVLMWALPFGYREGLITSCIFAIALLSLVVVTGYLGQLSLVQLGLAGVAGFIVSHLSANFGIGFPWAPIIGIIAATLLGVAFGFPALRVRGVQLAVVTLAAAAALQTFWFNNGSWGAAVTGSSVPPPSLFGFTFGTNASFHGLGGGEPSPLFGWFCLIVLTVVALLVANLRRSGFGQQMLAVRANERAAAASGVSVRNVKLIGFAMAAGVAGVAGVLLSYSYGSITASSYSTLLGVALVAFVYITGITSVPGGIFGGIIYTAGLLAYALLDWFHLQGDWLNLIAGFVVVWAIASQPDGGGTVFFYGQFQHLRARILRRPLEGALPGAADRRAATELERSGDGLDSAKVTS